MSDKKVPSEEDFARAKAAMRHEYRGLSEVSSRILGRFKNAGLHAVFSFYTAELDRIGVYLFYERDDQIKEAERTGLTDQIKQAVIEELVDVGRGSRESLNVKFYMDSHEEVERNYEGNYYLRLR